MKKNLVEIFITKNCDACNDVIETIKPFICRRDIDIKLYHRDYDAEVFQERHVNICPATFANKKLIFYGSFTADELEKHIHKSNSIINYQQGVTTMKQQNFVKSTFAGLTGTAVMTMVMLMAPLMGMPEMNIGKMLGGFMGVPVALGWIAHFMIGTILALTYSTFFASRLSGQGWLRGALFGLLPWLMSQIIINPMMGAGVFASNTSAPVLMVMGSLLGHLVYGGVLGVVYGASSKVQVATSPM